MTNTGAHTFALPDGGTLVVPAPQSMTYTPAPPPKPRTIIGLDNPTPDAMLAPYVGARRVFAGNALPDCTKLPARVLAMPSMPMRATARPTTAAMQTMLLSRPVGVFIPNHECNRPGKPSPAEVASNMMWCRDEIDHANATGKVAWLLGINFDVYPQQHPDATHLTFDKFADAIEFADLVTWDIYADLNGARLPTLDTLMAPYRATRKAYPQKRGGVLELDVMARAPRGLAEHQAAADLIADAIDEVVDDGGHVVCVWGTGGDQVDKVTGKTIDYTLVPGSPEHTVVRDRMRTQ